MDIFSIPQLVGYIAMILTMYSSTKINDKKYFIMIFISMLVWAFHFYLLNAWTASFILIMVAIRSLLTIKYHSIYITIISAIIMVGGGLYTFQGWWSIIPIISSVIACYTTVKWVGYKLRLSLIMITGLWIIYDFICGSYAAFISDTISTLLYCYAAYKLHKQSNNLS